MKEEAKIRMKMNENKSTINSLYQEIGKKVYEKHVNSETIDIKTELEEECTKIDVLSSEIETCLNQLRELKDKKQCPNCFKEIDLSAKFCNYCGAKQEDAEAREVEFVNDDSSNEHEKFVSDSYIEVNEENSSNEANESQSNEEPENTEKQDENE